MIRLQYKQGIANLKAKENGDKVEVRCLYAFPHGSI